MPTVFASVSITIILFYLATMGMAYAHLLTVPLHMLWGIFMTILILLLQCLIFGFFIGSGKSIKRVVQENGLDGHWIQKTKDYKNQSYPALMLAILLSAVAGILGGGVAAGVVPVAVHHLLIWIALLLNARSLWISYKAVVENVTAIHQINQEVERRKNEGTALPVPTPAPVVIEKPVPAPVVQANQAAKYYFLAATVWVPYLYMKFSLGSRNFPLWPFILLSLACLVIGWLGSPRKASGT
jgi:hypothetical protein